MKLDMSTEGRAGAVMTEEVLDQGKGFKVIETK